MPLYTYEHPETEETVSISYTVHERRGSYIYRRQQGCSGERVFYAPREHQSTASIDPFSTKKLLRLKLETKKGSYGRRY